MDQSRRRRAKMAVCGIPVIRAQSARVRVSPLNVSQWFLRVFFACSLFGNHMQLEGL